MSVGIYLPIYYARFDCRIISYFYLHPDNDPYSESGPTTLRSRLPGEVAVCGVYLDLVHWVVGRHSYPILAVVILLYQGEY